ncbi:MAG: hypothetical protein R3314_02305 [Longimicrobiales bacterium]|nr:hypothetical protein [Longimicrobiales bacterium]
MFHDARPIRSMLVPVVTACALAACDGADPVAEPDRLAPTAPAQATVKAAMNQGLATFRRATAAYHDVAAARADGFVQILPCLENPDGEGGLGIPFARLDRFDATIDLSEPEILFYEPQENGRLRLVGGEPVVPVDAWTGEAPPSLFGREFHRNDAHGLYGLHMWIWHHNPDGIFAFWHPDVTCEFAAEQAA